MNFVAQFFSWLDAQLATYIGANTARVSAAIEPAVVTMGTMYVMLWGYLSLSGRIQEPMWEGIKRILTIAVILAVSVRLWLYNDILVDTFFNAPSQLAAAVVGAPSPVGVVDQIWLDGNRVAEALTAQGGVFQGEVSFYLAAVATYLAAGVVSVYTACLLALSKVAIAVLLAIGPLYIALLFFSATKRYFEQWIGLLANFAMVTVLVSLIGTLLLSVVSSAASAAVASGSGVTIAEAVRVIALCGLIGLIMLQVKPIAAGLGGGIALTTFGVIGRAVDWGLGGAKRTAYQGMRGVIDGLRGDPPSRWDSLRRIGGNMLGSGVRRLWTRARGSGEGGEVVPRDRVMPSVNRR
jgi:type IV secretion system protein VirB6